MADPEFHYSGAEFEALASADNYYAWIMDLFGRHLAGHVVEVGAGHGNFSSRLLRRDAVKQLTLIEPSENLLPTLRSRFADEPRARVLPGTFDASVEGGPFDAIVLVNVLEHIQDDAAIARDAWAQLRPGGALLLFVPALPVLFGSLDETFGHYRRYTRNGLRRLLESEDFRLDRLRFVNSLGIFTWFLAGRVFRQRTVKPAQVRLYDRLAIPIVRAVETVVSPPFAQSMLAVAVKPDRAE